VTNDSQVVRFAQARSLSRGEMHPGMPTVSCAVPVAAAHLAHLGSRAKSARSRPVLLLFGVGLMSRLSLLADYLTACAKHLTRPSQSTYGHHDRITAGLRMRISRRGLRRETTGSCRPLRMQHGFLVQPVLGPSMLPVLMTALGGGVAQPCASNDVQEPCVPRSLTEWSLHCGLAWGVS
jgi:hypothetical protein